MLERNIPWGRPYKIVIKEANHTDGIPRIRTLDRKSTINEEESSQVMRDVKFPVDLTNKGVPIETPAEMRNVEPFTLDEIAGYLKRSRNQLAPGLDEIDYKTLKELNKIHPAILHNLYNACLRWGIFHKTNKGEN